VWPLPAAPPERERARAIASGAAGAPVAGDEPEPRRVLGADALASMRHTRVLSAGALERYGDCPVRWLVEGELRPDALVPTPDPITRGNLIHAALERLLAELDGPITAASLPAARAIIVRVVAELAADPELVPAPGSPEVVRRGALREIEADLIRYAEHEARSDGPWRPMGLELRFGFDDEREGSLPALALGDPADPVLVRGVIDRVDTDGAGHAVVRDYKSGRQGADWPAARWSPDRRLQVALYMLVVRELAGLDPVAGFYQPLRGPDLRGRGVYVEGTAVGAALPTDAREPGERDALLADAAQRAVALAGSLRTGELTPCPQTCSRDGCAYPGICRSQ
jgi:RecB family exonuclease